MSNDHTLRNVLLSLAFFAPVVAVFILALLFTAVDTLDDCEYNRCHKKLACT